MFKERLEYILKGKTGYIECSCCGTCYLTPQPKLYNFNWFKKNTCVNCGMDLLHMVQENVPVEVNIYVCLQLEIHYVAGLLDNML